MALRGSGVEGSTSILLWINGWEGGEVGEVWIGSSNLGSGRVGRKIENRRERR